MQAFSEDLRAIAMDPFGSHVLQKLALSIAFNDQVKQHYTRWLEWYFKITFYNFRNQAKMILKFPSTGWLSSANLWSTITRISLLIFTPPTCLGLHFSAQQDIERWTGNVNPSKTLKDYKWPPSASKVFCILLRQWVAFWKFYPLLLTRQSQSTSSRVVFCVNSILILNYY